MPDETDQPAPPGAHRSTIERLETLRVETSRAAKLAAELDRAVATLAKQVPRLEAAPRQVLDSVKHLRDLASKVAGAPNVEPALDGLEEAARAAEGRAAARFGTALAATLARLLPEGPELKPTDNGFACGAIRIVIDAAAGRAQVEFARRTVLRGLALDPEAVGEATARFLGDLEIPPFDPDVFLRHLSAAYALGVTAANRAPGELVDILAFFGHLAWEMQSEGFRRDPSAKRFKDYPLFRFAHDLARLRASRRFEVGGRKLELEVAVHDRAYGRSLWVPDEKGGGSYFQAIGLR
ncbi:MAG: hypothetical protein HY815_07015 [Candidatus Riflebacteria bacterium]|nr:hypothetical protein [Candidatus Riflebacteria bacterium]